MGATDFDDFSRELASLAEGGLTPLEASHAANGRAAAACQLSGVVGILEAGVRPICRSSRATRRAP
jgi:imidazolonepropionase-like amidohydrolase